jgi:hypothetical protein
MRDSRISLKTFNQPINNKRTMNQKEKMFSGFSKPKIKGMENHKRLLKRALFLEHNKRLKAGSFIRILSSILKDMSLPKKSVAFGALAIAGIFILAGVIGPSSFSVANAEAQETINRAFVRLANLSDEERSILHKEFHEYHEVMRMAIRGDQDETSLADILAEAKEALDLRIISADEMPVHGFLGRAGRAFGFKMMHKTGDHEARFALLPEDVRENFTISTTPDGKTVYRHGEERHEKSMPASFMVYTNSEGNTVYLGMNENDEPTFVLVTNGELPTESKRMIIRSEGGDVPQDGQRMYLKSEGDALPGGEGKQLFNENGEPVVR